MYDIRSRCILGVIGVVLERYNEIGTVVQGCIEGVLRVCVDDVC